ncbi:MAG: tRNA (N(6)-L-threonylcarbamoyladenosine(37)-C(2))-methylthiotransferase MtaB, partial [Eubacterium sp.]|nr:tRNA (N(6)-L-threonylcarbamoyladenosine(37)-C(2))-methylthiotransferase MtaB [Eubacterium sp.]
NYSVRKGTRAETMEGHVPEEVKTRRSNVLLKMAEKHRQAYETSYLGCREEILLEEEVIHEGEAYYQGYTRHYIKVLIPCRDCPVRLHSNRIVHAVLEKKPEENLILGKVCH